MITKFQVAYKNLLRKKARSSLTIIGIALSASSGLTRGMRPRSTGTLITWVFN
jgi:hypothetical protein